MEIHSLEKNNKDIIVDVNHLVFKQTENNKTVLISIKWNKNQTML